MDRKFVGLVVDDVHADAYIARKAIEGCTSHIYEARNGAEALLVLEAHPEIDLMVSDVYMPKLDGYELTREARKLVRRQPLTIVLVSSQMNAKWAKDAGADLCADKAGDIKQVIINYLKLAQLEL